MDLLALCLAATCVLYVNADKKISQTGFFPNTLDIACRQLTPSTCPVRGNWTGRCPREMKVKGGAGRNGSFRIKLHKELKTWDEALKVCQSKGGTLAMPKTKEKQKALKRRGPGRNDVWIGLKDIDGKNTFRWTDGESLTDTDWRFGEPNDREERCGCYGPTRSWLRGWNDLGCNRKRWFWCQY